MTANEVAKTASQMMFVFVLGTMVSYLFYQWYIKRYGYFEFMNFAKHYLRASGIFAIALIIIQLIFAFMGGKP